VRECASRGGAALESTAFVDGHGRRGVWSSQAPSLQTCSVGWLSSGKPDVGGGRSAAKGDSEFGRPDGKAIEIAISRPGGRWKQADGGAAFGGVGESARTRFRRFGRGVCIQPSDWMAVAGSAGHSGWCAGARPGASGATPYAFFSVKKNPDPRARRNMGRKKSASGIRGFLLLRVRYSPRRGYQGEFPGGKDVQIGGVLLGAREQVSDRCAVTRARSTASTGLGLDATRQEDDKGAGARPCARCGGGTAAGV